MASAAPVLARAAADVLRVGLRGCRSAREQLVRPQPAARSRRHDGALTCRHARSAADQNTGSGDAGSGVCASGCVRFAPRLLTVR